MGNQAAAFAVLALICGACVSDASIATAGARPIHGEPLRLSDAPCFFIVNCCPTALPPSMQRILGSHSCSPLRLVSAVLTQRVHSFSRPESNHKISLETAAVQVSATDIFTVD